MTTGLLIGIFAALVWSITNIVDKYLVDKYAPAGNIGGVLLLSCFFPFILLIMAALVSPESIMRVSVIEAFYSMTAGALMVMWIFFYLKALSEDDPSVVMTLLVLSPFFSLFFAQFILGEFLTSGQIMAGAFMISGALVAVYEPRNNYFKWKLFGYAVTASATTGFMTSVFKSVAVDAGVWESLFWRSTGMVLVGLIIYLLSRRYRHDFHDFIQAHFTKAIGLNITNESLTLIGDTLFAFAMLFIPIALLQTTEAYQPIFVFIMILILNHLGFSMVTENIEKRTLIQKGAGFCLVLIGTMFLTFLS